MKVVIVGPAYPYRGGIAALNERLAHQFIAEGNEVKLYTFTLQYPSFLFPGKTQFSQEEAPEGLEIVRKINSCNPFNWIKVGREIRREGADIIIFRFWLPFMAPCLGTIARIARKGSRAIAVVDNIIPHEKRIGDKLFASYFVSSVDSFVAMSHSVLEDLKLFDAKKPKLFSPHPIYDVYGQRVDREEAAKVLGLDSRCRYLLFFGLIRDYKGLDWLLRAYANSSFVYNDVKLLVAGEFYGDGDKYFDLCKELAIEDKVIWHSKFIRDDDVRYYFSISDIVVQPYKSATQSGITQVAYHFGSPMIVTNVGGLAEIVPDQKVGYCVDPKVEAITAALEDFFNNHRQNDFASGLASEKEKYTWDKMTKTISTLAHHSPLK